MSEQNLWVVELCGRRVYVYNRTFKVVPELNVWVDSECHKADLLYTTTKQEAINVAVAVLEDVIWECKEQIQELFYQAEEE